MGEKFYSIIDRGYTEEEFNKHIECNPDNWLRFGNGESCKAIIDEEKTLETYNMVHRNMNGMMDFIFEGQCITIITNGNTPDYTLFCGPEVASILGYDHVPSMYRMLDDCEKIDIDITNLTVRNMYSQDSQHGGLRHMTFITLPGLFKVISRSRHPKAIEFQNWIYHVVLPNMWFNGCYISPDTRDMLQQNPAYINTLNSRITELESQNQSLNSQIEEMTPLANMGKFCYEHTNNITINEFAKLLQNVIPTMRIGEHELRAWMREDGFLLSRDDVYNRPSDYCMDNKMMTLKYNNNGSNYTVLITNKGIKYFTDFYVKRFCRKEYN